MRFRKDSAVERTWNTTQLLNRIRTRAAGRRSGPEHYLLLLVRAEVQEDVQVLELSGGTFVDQLLQRRHAQINPRLKQNQQNHLRRANRI